MSNDQDTGAQISNTAVIAVCALVSLVLTAVVILTVFDKPVDNVLIICGTLIAPTVGTFLAARKLDKNNAVLKDVSVKVNGRLDALLEAKARNEAEITSLKALIPLPSVSPEDSPDFSATAIIERIAEDGR